MESIIEKAKRVRVTFTLPRAVVKQLEEYAKTTGEKKSRIVTKALESYFKSKQ